MLQIGRGEIAGNFGTAKGRGANRKGMSESTMNANMELAAMRKSKSWRAEEMRELILSMDVAKEAFTNLYKGDRAELETASGIHIQESLRRVHAVRKAAMTLERRLRAQGKGEMGTKEGQAVPARGKRRVGSNRVA